MSVAQGPDLDYISTDIIKPPPNYRGDAVWVRVTGHLGDRHGDLIQQWVLENGLGIRRSFDTWAMIDNAAATIFVLRWNHVKISELQSKD